MTRNWKLFTTSMGILSVAVALFSLRYLAPSWPLAPGSVARNAFSHPFLPIHATFAAIALLVAPFQFLVTQRGARQPWHKLVGRIYVVSCLASAPAGLILAFGVTTGPIATAGFGTLAVVWFVVNALGWKAAMDGRFPEHRRWMIRSFALTFGAVNLRLYLPLSPLLHIDFDTLYRAVSFLAWVPNLIVAEILLRTWLATPLQPRARMVGVAA